MKSHGFKFGAWLDADEFAFCNAASKKRVAEIEESFEEKELRERRARINSRRKKMKRGDDNAMG